MQCRRDLTDALSITPAYLRNAFSDSGLVTDYRDWQIPLGRRFRALKVWFVLRTYGVNGIRDLVRSHIAMGAQFAEWVQSRPDLFALVTSPAFALTVFTVVTERVPVAHAKACSDTTKLEPAGYRESGQDLPPATTIQETDASAGDSLPPADSDETREASNAVTREVYEAINTDRTFFLSSTVIGGIYAIRVVSANPQAEARYLRELFDLLVETTEHQLAKRHVQARPGPQQDASGTGRRPGEGR